LSKLLRGSLKKELLELIVLAAAASLLLFWALGQGADFALDHWFRMSDYIGRQYSRTVQQLQSYVELNHVGMSDRNALTLWVRAHKEVELSVFEGDVLLYSSDRSDTDAADYLADTNLGYDRVRHYNLTFADGTADIFLFGSFDYKLYVTVLVGDLLASVLVFFLIVGKGVNRCLGTIGRLEDAVAALEGGDLEQPVPAEGPDELGQLARQLDEMRRSLAAQMRTERQAREANRELITAMSHDLRTPLTALLLYAQLLKNGTYRDRAEMEEYIDHINSRALQIKDQSDALFCHFLVDGSREADTAWEAVKALFPDLLSDFICTLGARGLTCRAEGAWPDGKICVCEDYLMRILDNLLSNLLKYADRGAPVRLHYGAEAGDFCLTVRSRTAAHRARAPSTKIGLANVAAMMRSMRGSCTFSEQGGEYTTVLRFCMQGADAPAPAPEKPGAPA
jgi:signal transduction histidine kinase